jgi:membrane protein
MLDYADRDPRQSSRGSGFRTPEDIPAVGWKDIFWRSWNELSDNDIFLAAGGVTYAVLLALFPTLAALVSLYGLFMDPGQIEEQVDAMSVVLPGEMRQMLDQELHQLTSTPHDTLTLGAVLGVLLALWSASRGMSGLISALDIAYGVKERRSFLRFNLVGIALTIGFLIAGTVAVALIAGLPAVVQFVGLGGITKWLLLVVHWPVLIALWFLGLAVLYCYAPDRREAQWQWVSPGAICATVLWIVASVAFTTYVANFSSYDKTYGSLAGVVVLLTWLYLTSFVVLLGAVINAQAGARRSSYCSPLPSPE